MRFNAAGRAASATRYAVISARKLVPFGMLAPKFSATGVCDYGPDNV